jgi:YVTN family beta-propeller protein
MIIHSRILGAAVAAGLGFAAWSTGAAALDDLGNYVFVPNRSSADVAVIDTRLDAVVARVEVGNVPHQVAVSDTTGKMITSNTADNTISIMDLESLQEIATLTLGNEPEHMELSPSGDLLAVGNIGDGTVSLISLADNTEMRRIEGLHEPHNMTFSPDGSTLYVGNLGANFVSTIDVESGNVSAEIVVGNEKPLAALGGVNEAYQGIINVTATPDGRLGFAAYGEGDRMAVIDLRTQERIKTLTLGDTPWRAFTTADGRYMIVPNNGDQTISVFSTSTLEEVARLPGAADMTGVNTGWLETLAYVISRGDDKAVIIDLTTMERVGEIALPGSPETGVTTPDGTKLYVALSDSDAVAVIDVRGQKLLTMIEGVGDEPWGAHMVGAVNYCH